MINSGEGGFITTEDDEMAARAIYLAGAYERRYGERHRRGHAQRPFFVAWDHIGLIAVAGAFECLKYCIGSVAMAPVAHSSCVTSCIGLVAVATPIRVSLDHVLSWLLPWLGTVAASFKRRGLAFQQNPGGRDGGWCRCVLDVKRRRGRARRLF